MIREAVFMLAVFGSSNLYSQPMVIIRSVESDKPGSSGSIVKRYGLDRQDAQSIPEFVRGIQMIQLSASRVILVKRTNPQTLDSEMKAVMLTAVSPGHRIRRNLQIVLGRDLENQDFSEATSRCLISAELAAQWFGGQPAVGRFVRIQGNTSLLVAGVFESEHRPNMLIESPDVLIPITTFDQRFSKTILHRANASLSASQVHYSEFQVDIADDSELSDAGDSIREYLSRRHPDRKFLVSRLRLKDPQ